jgi:hypothetical protein
MPLNNPYGHIRGVGLELHSFLFSVLNSEHLFHILQQHGQVGDIL